MQWVFVILLSVSVIANFRGTCSSVEMLKGFMVMERLETLPLNNEQNNKQPAHFHLSSSFNLLLGCTRFQGSCLEEAILDVLHQ